MSKAIFSIDVQDGLVSGVLLQSHAGKPVISGWGAVELGEHSLGKALLELKEQVGFAGGACRISFGAEHFFFKNVTLPFTDGKKILQVLPFEIEDASPVDSNDVIIDAVYNRLDRKQTDVIAAMFRQDFLAATLLDMDASGLDPEIITISSVEAATRLARLSGSPSDFLFLYIGVARATVVVVWDSKVRLIRPFTFDIGDRGGDRRLDKDLRPILPAQSEYLSNVLPSLVSSIKQTLHATIGHDEIPLVYLSGPCAGVKGLPENLKDSFTVEIRRCDLLGDPVKIRSDSPHNRVWIPEIMDQALALGLRSANEKNCFNFRKGWAGQRELLKYRRILRGRLGYVTVVAILLLVCFLGYDFFSLKMEEKRLTNQIQTIFSETLPNVSRIVDPVAQLQAEIKRIAYTGGGGIQYGYRALELLREVSRRIPDSARVRLTQMTMNEKGVRLKGITDTFNTVDSIKKELQQSPFFDSVTIVSANLSTQGDGILFEMTLQLKNP